MNDGALALKVGVLLHEVGEKHGANGEKHGEICACRDNRGLQDGREGLGVWYFFIVSWVIIT